MQKIPAEKFDFTNPTQIMIMAGDVLATQHGTLEKAFYMIIQDGLLCLRIPKQCKKEDILIEHITNWQVHHGLQGDGWNQIAHKIINSKEAIQCVEIL